MQNLAHARKAGVTLTVGSNTAASQQATLPVRPVVPVVLLLVGARPRAVTPPATAPHAVPLGTTLMDPLVASLVCACSSYTCVEVHGPVTPSCGPSVVNRQVIAACWAVGVGCGTVCVPLTAVPAPVCVPIIRLVRAIPGNIPTTASSGSAAVSAIPPAPAAAVEPASALIPVLLLVLAAVMACVSVLLLAMVVVFATIGAVRLVTFLTALTGRGATVAAPASAPAAAHGTA